ncbi:MAG: T9SS type A sorting domain-containing protein, partial [Sphingobacteriia bacterium]|nr:T9SS type A sorting domain-containing protein [Sphingobacteriia bacterium]
GGEIITDQFQITNTGHVCTLMDFAIEISYILPAPESSAGKTQEWLTVTPTSGQVAGQTAEIIALTVNTAGLRAGTYYAAIDITTNAQNIQHFIVPVFLDIIISVDESDKMDIQIFPNPTEGMFTISGNRMEAKINIINAFGLEILNTKINLPSVIDLSPWPAGIYFIKIESFEKRWLDKLFVK